MLTLINRPIHISLTEMDLIEGPWRQAQGLSDVCVSDPKFPEEV